MATRWMAAVAVVGVAVAGVSAGSHPKMVASKHHPVALVIRVSGRGPAGDITWDVDDQIDQRSGAIRLPWIHKDRNWAAVHADGVSVLAQTNSSSPSAKITCKITESGRQVAKGTSEGPYAVASCSYYG